MAGLVFDGDQVAAFEVAACCHDTCGQQRSAAPQCPHRAAVDSDSSLGCQRPANPSLARGQWAVLGAEDGVSRTLVRLFTGRSTRPSQMTMLQPAFIAIRAASSLVIMPPDA